MAEKLDPQRRETQFAHLHGVRSASGEAREAEVLLEAKPRMSMVASRQANETLVIRLHRKHLGPKPRDVDLTIRALQKAGILPKEVAQASHYVRIQGNQATHHSTRRTRDDALAVLGSLFEVTKACSAILKGEEPDPQLRFDPEAALRIGRANDHETERDRSDSALDQERERSAALAMRTPEVAAALESPDTTEEDLLAIGQEALGADDDEFAQHPLRDHLITALLENAAWGDGTRSPGTASFPDRSGSLHAIDHAAWSEAPWPLAILETTHSRTSLQAGMAYAEAVADLIEAEHGHRPVVLASNGLEHLRRAPGGRTEVVREFDSYAELTASAGS